MHTSTVKAQLRGPQIGPTPFIKKTVNPFPRLAPGRFTLKTKPSPADTLFSGCRYKLVISIGNRTPFYIYVC